MTRAEEGDDADSRLELPLRADVVREVGDVAADASGLSLEILVPRDRDDATDTVD